MGYLSDARSDAVDTVGNFLDEVVEQLIDKGEASDDLFNDYPSGDEYHHQSHVDKYYRLSEAAELLDELSRYEETDSGLWEGLEPCRAIAAQAAYTYGSAVLAMWSELISEINGDDEAETIRDAVVNLADWEGEDEADRGEKPETAYDTSEEAKAALEKRLRAIMDEF
jgi:hypothetical protein